MFAEYTCCLLFFLHLYTFLTFVFIQAQFSDLFLVPFDEGSRHVSSNKHTHTSSSGGAHG